MPPQMKFKVEMKFLAVNSSSLVTAWYDFPNNKARINSQAFLSNKDTYYDYANKEVLNVDRFDNGQWYKSQ